MAIFTLPLLLLLVGPFITVVRAPATLAVVNSCQETIWPALSEAFSSQNHSITGFALEPGESMLLEADSWSGSIWARTHCSRNSTGQFTCLTGDCGSGTLECIGGTGVGPRTMADIGLNTFGRGQDSYDISLVTGFNLPISVISLAIGYNCTAVRCTGDVIGTCPEELKMMTGGGGGQVVACSSACEALKKDEYCCKGDFAESSACKPTNYSNIFKKSCPQAYTYPMDDASHSFSCPGSAYSITFCPGSNVSQVLSGVSVDATSMLRPGDQLNSSSQLVSQGGTFTLGFFTIRDTNLGYLGIWYTGDEHQRKVWVANPNSPIILSNNDSHFALDSTGNLRIFSGARPVMYFAVHVVTSDKAMAVLLDSGNFVLVDSRAGNRTLWQSFDHPTDTLLPGMKLGLNLTAQQNWTLVSWLGFDDASSGAFTASLERTPDSGEVVIRRRGEAYWTSGPWKKNGFPRLSSLKGKLDFMTTNDGMYFTFRTSSSGKFAMLTLSPDGIIIDGENRTITPFPTFCYGYENDNGCVTTSYLNCRNESNIFERKTGAFVGGEILRRDENITMSLSDCMEKCWNDCSCNGFVNNIHGTGCVTWVNGARFQVNDSSSAVSAYVLAAKETPKGKRKTWIWIVIVISVVMVVLLLLLGIVCGRKIKRRKAKEEKRLRDEYIHQLTQSENSGHVVGETQKNARESELNILSFSSIVAATNDFSAENKLGEGGFGPVYKGKLLDGREVAVKRLSRLSGQGLVEFKNELILISRLQHTNLVRVLGCCIHEEEKMLIYEYMPNKSLDFFLFDKDKRFELDWKKRINIIEGVAQGLLYLHKYSRMRVIHRDLKASNVLLDDEMSPKIADFGMARIFKQNETEAMTKRIVGTYGYMSPEYAMGGTFSIKSDVFSFGVLILEVISGRRCSSLQDIDDHSLNLIGYAWELWRLGKALELKDSSLGEAYDSKMLLRTIHVGLLCVQASATDRPTMLEVISMLNDESLALPSPKQPAFFTGRRDLNLGSTSSEVNQGINLPVSVNDMTISVIEPR